MNVTRSTQKLPFPRFLTLKMVPKPFRNYPKIKVLGQFFKNGSKGFCWFSPVQSRCSCSLFFFFFFHLIFSPNISKQKHLRYRLTASSDIATQTILFLIGREHFGLKLTKQNFPHIGSTEKRDNCKFFQQIVMIKFSEEIFCQFSSTQEFSW